MSPLQPRRAHTDAEVAATIREAERMLGSCRPEPEEVVDIFRLARGERVETGLLDEALENVQPRHQSWHRIMRDKHVAMIDGTWSR